MSLILFFFEIWIPPLAPDQVQLSPPSPLPPPSESLFPLSQPSSLLELASVWTGRYWSSHRANPFMFVSWGWTGLTFSLSTLRFALAFLPPRHGGTAGWHDGACEVTTLLWTLEVRTHVTLSHEKALSDCSLLTDLLLNLTEERKGKPSSSSFKSPLNKCSVLQTAF